MIDELRKTMQTAFAMRPKQLVVREMWALRLICVFYLIGIPRLVFGFRFPFDTALLMVLSVAIVVLYPFNIILQQAFNERTLPSPLRKDARFALFILTMFAVFWILIML